MSQTTRTTWAVCLCTDGKHTKFDHHAFTPDRAEAVRQVSGYEPTAHVIERQTVEATRTVFAGAASPLNPPDRATSSRSTESEVTR